MTQSVIIVGPQGCGKTLNAPRLAKAFGLKHWTDWDGSRKLPAEDHLILTNEVPPGVATLSVVSFEDAIQKVENPHPATPKRLSQLQPTARTIEPPPDLRTAAVDVIAAFEELGKATHAPGLLMARRRCESVMLKLREALKA